MALIINAISLICNRLNLISPIFLFNYNY